MSTDRDTRRIVRSWLKTEERESADRVLDAVLDRLDTTPQRRATWWPARRNPDMSNIFRISIAAAAVEYEVISCGAEYPVRSRRAVQSVRLAGSFNGSHGRPRV
jgi:hypothetical protein